LAVIGSGVNIGATTTPQAKLEVMKDLMVSAWNPFFYLNGTWQSIPNRASIGIRSAGEVVMNSNRNNPNIVDWEIKYGSGTYPAFPNDAFYISRKTSPTSTPSYYMLINSSGNVGIGTMEPLTINTTRNYQFGLRQNDKVLTISSENYGSVLNLETRIPLSKEYTDQNIGAILFSTTQGQADAHRQVAGIVARAKDLINNSNGTPYTYTSELGFFTKHGARAEERMTITANGNVGIGTATPTQKLDVVGYVRGSQGLCIGNDCITSWPTGGGGNTSISDIYCNTLETGIK
jgi:hypothetical protein